MGTDTDTNLIFGLGEQLLISWYAYDRIYPISSSLHCIELIAISFIVFIDTLYLWCSHQACVFCRI